MYNTFISKGVPVVIGEFGATNKSNTAYREKYAGIYASLARQFAAQDIPCVWWDNNCFGTGSENFGIFNRGSRSFTYGGIADALVAAYNGDPQYETATGGENVLFSGTGTSSNYGQAVSFDPGAITSLSSSDKIYCSYSSYGDIEFILQSFTDSSRGWIQVAPDSVSNGTAGWSVSSLKSAFGGSFSGLGKAYIGDRGSSLTVTKVYVPGGTAHTHVYNGKSAVALEATAYTKGRKQIYCSVSGCTAYRIVTVPKLDSTRPVITSVTAGTEQATVAWSAVSGATKYEVFTYLNDKWTSHGNTTACNMTVKNLTGGTSYGFVVKAYVNGSWSGITSADIVYATPVGASVKPVITKAQGQDGRVALNWTSVNGATNYAVYTYLNGKWSLAGYRTANGMYVTGLTNGVKYGFAVKAYVNGAWTNIVSSDIVYATPTADKADVMYADTESFISDDIFDIGIEDIDIGLPDIA